MAPEVSRGRQQQADFASTIAKLLGPNTGVAPLPGANSLAAATMKATLQKAMINVSKKSSGSGIKTYAQMLADGTATDQIKKALDTNTKTKARVSVAKKPSKSIRERLTSLPGELVTKPLDALTRTLDIVSRPGYSVTAGLKAGIDQAQKGHNVADVLTQNIRHPAAVLKGEWKGISGKDKTGTGGILKNEGILQGKGIASKLARGSLALAGDVVTDPLSWVATPVAGKGAEGVAKVLENLKLAKNAAGRPVLNAPVLKALAEWHQEFSRVIGAGASRGAKALGKAEIEAMSKHAAKTMKDHILNLPSTKARYRLEHAQAVRSGLRGAAADEAARLATETALVEPRLLDLEEALQKGLAPLGKSHIEIRPGFLGRGSNIISEDLGEKLIKPFAKTKEFIQHAGPGKFYANHLNFENRFPGLYQELTRAGMSKGVSQHLAFKATISKIFEHVPYEMRKLVSHAIEDDTDLSAYAIKGISGRTLEDVRQETMQLYRDIAAEEVKLGIRKQSDLIDKGYIYQHYGTRARRKEAEAFRTARKDTLSQPLMKDITSGNITMTPTIKGKTLSTGLKIDDAKALGLKPEEDAAAGLLARNAKSSRDIVRNMIHTDFITAYGEKFASKVAHEKELNMRQIPDRLLTKDLKAGMKPGEVWYAPNQILDVFEEMAKLGSWKNPDEINSVLHYIDSANRWFKMSKTVFRPGYHLNNMVGDAFFGYLDNIGAKYYGSTIRKMAEAKAGKSAEMTVGKDFKIPYAEIKNSYDKLAASGGYMSADLGKGLYPSLTDARHLGAKFTEGARHASEVREDFGRFVHYYGALDQEFGVLAKNNRKLKNYLLMKQGKITNPAVAQAAQREYDRVLEEAQKRAARRVNKYKFDYAAKTVTEEKYLSRVVPFYTWVRKATPLLMQQMVTSPGRILAVDKAKRAIETGLGIEDQGWDRLRIPDYLREMGGYIQGSAGDNPAVLNLGQWNPTYSLPDPSGGAQSDSSLMSSILQRLSPGIRAPIEIATGKTLFNNQPVPNAGEAILQNINPFDWVTSINKRQGQGLLKPLEFAGVPVTRLSTNQQVASIKKDTSDYTAIITQINKGLAKRGLEVSTSTRKSGTVYRLLDRIHGRVIGVYGSPAEAQKAADSIKK